MRYLTISELIYINGTVLRSPKILAGQQDTRDPAMLEAAAARPESSAFGADAYPTLAEKVAALFHSLTRNHPFTDGNKRTAVVAAIFMFRVNGARILWDQAEALKTVLAVAQGQRTASELSVWFPVDPIAPSPEPNVEIDMALIAEIVAEQSWLLHALERQ